MPSLDLALCLGMQRRASDMIDAVVGEPFGQVAGLQVSALKGGSA